MIRTSTLIFVSLLLFSCTNRSSIEPFKEYCSFFPVRTLPLLFWCGEAKVEYKDLRQMDTSLSFRYPRFQHFEYAVGRIFPNRKYVTLVYAAAQWTLHPWIVTFTEKGEQIDSLYLGGSCGRGIGGHSTTFAIIDTNFVISVIDTIENREYDKAFHIIPGKDTTYREVRTHQLDDTGRFIFLNNNKKILSVK
jgi:hypothetical protein